MANPLRPRIRGGIYHAMNRGVRKVLIFADDADRRRFARILIETAEEYDVEICADTQMGTHFHLVVVTPHGNISEFMQAFESEFARYVNWRHGHTGHVVQGAFRAVVIENDLHLFTALWYVFNNPRQSGLVERSEKWPWSSYAATIGLKRKPHYLSLSWLATLFPADSLNASQRLFRRCMEDPRPIHAYLRAVDPTAAESIGSYVSERLKRMKGPTSYRELFRPPLDHLFPPDQVKIERNKAIVVAHVIHGYTLAQIARATRLHAGSVGRIFRATRRSSLERQN